jgi:hypothetical protein
MRFFITNSFDATESAELNAVILGIIVAVLVILLPRQVRLDQCSRRRANALNAKSMPWEYQQFSSRVSGGTSTHLRLTSNSKTCVFGSNR